MTSKKNVGTGIQVEYWWQSRRIWGAVLAGVAAVLIQFGQSELATGLITIAGAFGVTSWVKPK